MSDKFNYLPGLKNTSYMSLEPFIIMNRSPHPEAKEPGGGGRFMMIQRGWNKMWIRLLLILASSCFIFALLSYPGQKLKEWKGRIEIENGVKVIKNPQQPLFGEVILEIEEDLVIGNEDDENYIFYKGISVAIDNNNNIYVSDLGNHRVQKFNYNGQFLQTIGKKGQGPGEFEHPSDITFDKDYNIYVEDGFTIEKFDKSGKFIKSIKLGTSFISWGVTFEGNIIGVDFHYNSNGLIWKLIHFDFISGTSDVIKAFEPHKFGRHRDIFSL